MAHSVIILALGASISWVSLFVNRSPARRLGPSGAFAFVVGTNFLGN